MCGIVAYAGPGDTTAILLEGLRRLEYRGYDSAGIAVAARRKIKRVRVVGRVEELSDPVGSDLTGSYPAGIAHTRWASHGPATTANCHPHTDGSGRIAIAHNGILDNAEQLRAEIVAAGGTLTSDTDSEVLAHLIAAQLDAGAESLVAATSAALARVRGTYGLVVLDAREPDTIVAARHGSPVVIGVGNGEMFIASDPAAIAHHTRKVVYLDDGELATVTAGDYATITRDSRRTIKAPVELSAAAEGYELDGYPDFMTREMHAQPEAMRRALAGRLDPRWGTTRLDGILLDARELRSLRRVTIFGCGSAYYAAEAGALLIEQLARIPAEAQPASELRYRNPVVDSDTLYIAVSQSGETADTLVAVEELQRKGARVIGCVNVVGSSIGRACGQGMFLHAGPEVSVASTKAVTNMTLSFAMLAVLLGRIRDLSPADGARLVAALEKLPDQVEQILADDEHIAQIARTYANADRMFFLGQVRGWPVAREGAQKLKEISYIHAEAYPGSELKHGPLALIDESMPSVVVIPDDDILERNLSTIEQIAARGGPVIAVTSADLPKSAPITHTIRVPRNSPELDPILLTIPLQMFAYHTAVALGRDVDKPRNLAKSVTVA